MSTNRRFAPFLVAISSILACLAISDVSAKPGDFMSPAPVSAPHLSKATVWQAALNAKTSSLDTVQRPVQQTAGDGSNFNLLFTPFTALMLALMVLCGFLAHTLWRSKKRIHEFNVVTKKLLSGDFSVKVSGANLRGEFGSFARKLTKLRDNLDQAHTDSLVANFYSSAVEDSSVAMMMVDRDFTVTHINEATKKLLTDNAEIFRENWPAFNPDAIIGSCIDMFHKNPAHQRQLLSNPEALPFRTDISVGDLKFGLNVSGVFDSAGVYVGNVLEWNDVTTIRINEGKLDALDRSQAIIEFELDGTIVDADRKSVV